MVRVVDFCTNIPYHFPCSAVVIPVTVLPQILSALISVNSAHVQWLSTMTIFKAVIHCEGGASLGKIAQTAAGSNYVVPLGTAPTVGAGAVLMGGVGHLTRLYGMSVNNIIGLRIVSQAGLKVLGWEGR